MSELALLNAEGTVVKKLQLVSLPRGYVIPEGMIVSWRDAYRASSRSAMSAILNEHYREPPEAYFYLGKAWAQVLRTGSKESDLEDDSLRMSYGIRDLTVTVQGTSAEDVISLRDYIIQLIYSGQNWKAVNNLNPKPKPEKQRFFRRRRRKEQPA